MIPTMTAILFCLAFLVLGGTVGALAMAALVASKHREEPDAQPEQETLLPWPEIDPAFRRWQD